MGQSHRGANDPAPIPSRVREAAVCVGALVALPALRPPGSSPPSCIVEGRRVDVGRCAVFAYTWLVGVRRSSQNSTRLYGVDLSLGRHEIPPRKGGICVFRVQPSGNSLRRLQFININESAVLVLAVVGLMKKGNLKEADFRPRSFLSHGSGFGCVYRESASESASKSCN